MLSTKYIGFPYFTSCIFISEGCLKFTQLEMEGLIAHEIYHAKQHTLKWYLMKLLSDYSLFGGGFLAVASNSYYNELKADEYAISWLVRNNGSIDAYINSLIMLSSLRSVFERKHHGLNLVSEDPITKEKELFTNGSILNKIRMNINILLDVYFSDEILSYIHPSLEERRNRLKEIIKIQKGSHRKL